MESSKNQHEALKRWLRRYRELKRDVDLLYDRADDLRGRVEAARTSLLDGLPHGSRSDADRLGGIVAELEELETEALEAQQQASSARREIVTTIRQIHGPRWADKRECLRLRYIDGLRWEDCAERIFGDSQNYWNRQEAYLRRCFKLHGEALAELEQFVPLEQVQENDTEQE